MTLIFVCFTFLAKEYIEQNNLVDNFNSFVTFFIILKLLMLLINNQMISIKKIISGKVKKIPEFD